MASETVNKALQDEIAQAEMIAKSKIKYPHPKEYYVLCFKEDINTIVNDKLFKQKKYGRRTIFRFEPILFDLADSLQAIIEKTHL